jgi:tetratricopeptide (TPR) repeat protein
MENKPHISQAELEQIERFWRADFADSREEHALKEKYAHDPEWREKAYWVRLATIAIQEVTVSEQLNHFHMPFNQEKPVRKIFRWQWAVVASVVAVIGFASILLLKKSSEEKLFAQYYKPDVGLPTMMGISERYEFENAMVSYKTGDYQKAIDSWQLLLKDNPGNDTLNYFIGSALIADRQVKQALPYFDKTLTVSNSAFEQEARWFKALALLHMGKKQEAITLLEKTEHPEKENLLQKLKE